MRLGNKSVEKRGGGGITDGDVFYFGGSCCAHTLVVVVISQLEMPKPMPSDRFQCFFSVYSFTLCSVQLPQCSISGPSAQFEAASSKLLTSNSHDRGALCSPVLISDGLLGAADVTHGAPSVHTVHISDGLLGAADVRHDRRALCSPVHLFTFQTAYSELLTSHMTGAEGEEPENKNQMDNVIDIRWVAIVARDYGGMAIVA